MELVNPTRTALTEMKYIEWRVCCQEGAELSVEGVMTPIASVGQVRFNKRIPRYESELHVHFEHQIEIVLWADNHGISSLGVMQGLVQEEGQTKPGSN